MDKDSLMYGMDVLDEINGALEPIGLTVRKLDAEETQGLPVGLIVPTGENPSFSITCHVLPTHKDQVSTTFVQLFLPLTEPCPEKLEEMEKFAKECNSRFLLGTLFVYQDCLSMKYVTALEPTIALEGAHFQAAVFAFLQQAEEIGKKAQALCRGEITLEQVLGESAQ